MSILAQELAALYEAFAARPSLPELPVPMWYADYAVWQRRRLDGEALERQVAYWRQRSWPARRRSSSFPTDRPRPPVRSSRGGKLPFPLPRPLTDRLEQLARRNGGDPVHGPARRLSAALLARWSGQEDVVTGPTAATGRAASWRGSSASSSTPWCCAPIWTGRSVVQLAGAPGPRDVSSGPRRTATPVREAPGDAAAAARSGARRCSRRILVAELPADPGRPEHGRAPGLAAWTSPDLRLRPGPLGGRGRGGSRRRLEYSADLFDEPTLVRFAAQLRRCWKPPWTIPEAALDPARCSPRKSRRQLEAWSQGPAVPEGPPSCTAWSRSRPRARRPPWPWKPAKCPPDLRGAGRRSSGRAAPPRDRPRPGS